jgi:hypothetical protein
MTLRRILPSQDLRGVVSGPGGTRRTDSLVCGVSAMTTLPGRVVGAKPAAFCRWIFELLGARFDDLFDDLFPGSGSVTRAWHAFSTGSVASAGEHDTSGEPSAEALCDGSGEVRVP